MLETEIMLRTSDEQEYLATLFQEMPFWFSRMLTYGDEENETKQYWRVFIDRSSANYSSDEYELLEVMLQQVAIDRSEFWQDAAASLNTFT